MKITIKSNLWCTLNLTEFQQLFVKKKQPDSRPNLLIYITDWLDNGQSALGRNTVSVTGYSYHQPSVPSCSASSLWSFRTLVTAPASSCSSFRRVLFGSASTLWRRFCRNWYSRWSSRCSFSRHEYRVSWYCLSGSLNQRTTHLFKWTAPVNMRVDKIKLDDSFKLRPLLLAWV
jgi:hypothetical protein